MKPGAIQKMMRMFNDPKRLFAFARSVPNPSMSGTSTTWEGHVDPLRGLIEKIKEGIALGELMNCDMSAQKARASALYVPLGPNP
jgi:hypothetical protein